MGNAISRRDHRLPRRRGPGRPPQPAAPSPRTLAIDVGGSGLKASVLDPKGRLLTDPVRVRTPSPARPSVLVDALAELVRDLPPFQRVSVGFPGVVREGRVLTAPNLGTGPWRGFDLASALARRFGRPVRVLNDAEVQALAVVRRRGIELVVTLGTGVGTALFRDGRLAPHLELAHHPIRQGKTYDQYLGDRARKRVGKKKWNRRLRRAISLLSTLTNYDRLYLGGGNASRVELALPRNVTLVSNTAGILGGLALWEDWWT